LKDGPVRSAVKALALRVYDARLALHRMRKRERGEIPYELGGACVLCAKCCEAPGIQVGFLTWYVPLFQRIFLLWHQQVNGFELRERSRADRAFIFRCAHFDPKTRRCDSYHSRPGMCRDYPRPLMEQANPELFEGCGFKPVAKDRVRLLRALDQQPLSGEQQAKLRKELYLEE
jgi:Fe-S-cluster containining protein